MQTGSSVTGNWLWGQGSIPQRIPGKYHIQQDGEESGFCNLLWKMMADNMTPSEM